MDARPILETLARVLNENKLEAILIGNAAAALQGAPVTTVDLDLYFRRTPRNLEKLKAVAKALRAVILRPYYPVSGLFRLSRDLDGLQVDFMTQIDGVKSFEALRERPITVDFGGHKMWVADLAVVIESKRAAARPQDHAVMGILEAALREKKAPNTKTAARRVKKGK